MLSLELQNKLNSLSNGDEVKVTYRSYKTVERVVAILHKGITGCGKSYCYFMPKGEYHGGAAITLGDLLNIEPLPTGMTIEAYGDENFLFDNNSQQIITHIFPKL